MLETVKRYIPAFLFTVFACAIAALAIMTTMYSPAYAVYIDDELWGYVTDADSAEEQIHDAEEYIGEIRDEDYSIDYRIEEESSLISNGELINVSYMYNELCDSIEDITEGYVLKVDDEIIGIGDPDELNEIVEDVANQYAGENTVKVNVLSDVEVVYDTVPSETEDDTDKIADTLTSPTENEVVHTTQDGDTVEKLIDDNEISEDELFSLNPDLEKVETGDTEIVVESTADDSDKTGENLPELTIDPSDSSDDETPIEEGVDIVISPGKSVLSVETVDYESHKETIDYDTEIIDTDELYDNEYVVETVGKTGTRMIMEKVTSLNGTETDRVETTNALTKKPVTEVILHGTKELKEVENKNTTVQTATGTYYVTDYVWPLSSARSISSGFGSRWLNGSYEYHNGIDIPASYDTPIYASKGGTVIVNQYNGARGWYVQIKHDDGFTTTYQHMCRQSSLTVGQYVAQGQQVGNVGSTGYSFGNHLHFEVWAADNTPINPLTVLNQSATEHATYTDTLVTPESTDEMKEEQKEIVEYAKEFKSCPYLKGGHGSTTYEVKDLIAYIEDTYDVDVPDDMDSSPDVRSYVLKNYGVDVPFVFDDAGFVGFVYHHFGYDLPYTLTKQIELGTYVETDIDSIEEGDLIFFASDDNDEASHVGIYIGDEQYIHITDETEEVTIDDLNSEDDDQTIVAVRRVVS